MLKLNPGTLNNTAIELQCRVVPPQASAPHAAFLVRWPTLSLLRAHVPIMLVEPREVIWTRNAVDATRLHHAWIETFRFEFNAQVMHMTNIDVPVAP